MGHSLLGVSVDLLCSKTVHSMLRPQKLTRTADQLRGFGSYRSNCLEQQPLDGSCVAYPSAVREAELQVVEGQGRRQVLHGVREAGVVPRGACGLVEAQVDLQGSASGFDAYAASRS